MKVLLVLSLLLAVGTANPGLQAALNVADVNQILMIAYAFGLTTATFDLGNFSIAENVQPLGAVSLNLTNINITSISVDYANSVFTFQSPNFITYNVFDLSILATAGYSISVGGFPLSPGHMNISLSNTNATANLTVYAVNEQPQVSVNNFALQLGSIDVETDLPAEFNEMINQLITQEAGPLSSMIPGLIAQYLPIVNQALAGLNLKVAVPGTDLDIDLGLASSPEILDDEVLVVGLDGTVYQGGKPVAAGNAVSIPAQGVVSEGVQIGVTDFLVNSLLTPLWPYVNYTIDTLPAYLGSELTTDMCADVLPQLQETFGKGLPVSLTVRANGPIAYGTNGKVNVQAHALLDVKVKTGLFHWTLAATFAVKADIVATATVQNNVASVKIESFSLPSISVVHSFIGTLAIDVLKPAIDLTIKIVVSKVNDKLKSVVRDM